MNELKPKNSLLTALVILAVGLAFAVSLMVFLMYSKAHASDTSLRQCIQACLDAGSPVTPPPTPPPVTPGTKVFPGKLIFEERSNVATGQYAGKAVVLLPVEWAGKVLSVGLNGETGYKDTPYNGMPVFRYSKPGSQYSRPLKFVITGTDGQVYTATSNATPATPTTPPTPTGKNSETAKPSSCGNPEGANCRQNMRLMYKWDHYGPTPTVDCDGDKYFIKNSSVRQEESGGWIWKPVADSPNNKGIRGVVIVGKHGKKYQSCTVYW